MILTNLPLTHSIRINGVCSHNFDSYKNKANTNFITKRFLEKERLKERNQIYELNKYKQFTKECIYQNFKNITTTTTNTINNTKSFIDKKSNLLFNNINTPKFDIKPIVSSLSNIINTSQTKKCGNIYNEHAMVNKINKLKAKTIQKTLKKTVKKTLKLKSPKNSNKKLKITRQKSLKLEIEKDEISKNELVQFEQQRQKQIADMVNKMFPKQKNKILKNILIYNKTMYGKDKFIVKTKLLKDTIYKWEINMNDLININKMIFGIQIIGKNGKINTIYSNEHGMIFYNKKYIKYGLKIKNNFNVLISIKYTNYNEIMVYFNYFKNGKLVEIININNKPIIINDLNAFKFGVNAKVFIGQTNGQGKYKIINKKNC